MSQDQQSSQYNQPTQTQLEQFSYPPPRKRTGLWVWYRTRTRMVKIGFGIIIVMLLFLSCIGSAIRSTNHTTAPKLARTPIHGLFPGLADTTSNIHVALPFDYNTNPPAMAGKVDMVWGTRWASSLPGSIYGLFYLPYDQDENTRDHSTAHDITWYKANHPDWIEYKCDKSTVAYEFGETTSVPLDITNPAVVSYIEETYITTNLRPGSGYKGIGFDNLDFENAGKWTGQRCGHFNAHGTWVQQFNGTANDVAYRQSILTWAQRMHTFIHTHFPNAIMVVNFSYDPIFSTDSNALTNYVDLYADEQGFTNGNNASRKNPSAWYYTDATWLGKINWIQNALNLKRGFLSINQEPVPFARVTKKQIQWALANYLLVKNNASFVYICGKQEYGYVFIRPEYAAQIGSPVNAMYKIKMCM